MTDQSAPKRPDSCPSCGSENPKIYRTQREDGQWIYWESGKRTSQYSCSDPWHDTVATTTPQYPIPLNEHQLASIEIWAKDSGPSIGDVWGNEEVRRLNLTTFARKILGDAEPAPLTAEENQDDQTESSKMPVLRGERDSVSQQSPNVVVRDIPEGEIARVKKEENQDAGIHGRNSGGDVLGISGLGNSDGSVVNRRMGTGEVPATPSEHSVEVEENRMANLVPADCTECHHARERHDIEPPYLCYDCEGFRVAPPLTEAPQPISPQPQHPNPFCNFWNGPIGGPGCICKPTNSIQQLAVIKKALDYGEMFVVMCRDGKWIPDRNISPSVTKFLQIIREGRESFEQYQAGVALSSPSPAKTDIIPPMTHPLGQHWNQPPTSEIEVDDKFARMTQATFDSLPEYSTTRPSGVYEGKMWKRHDGAFDRAFLAKGGKPIWMLCWYGACDDPNMVSNHRREIVIVSSEPVVAVPAESPAPQLFKSKPLPDCACGSSAILDMNLHDCDCDRRLMYEYNCMVTHRYYEEGYMAALRQPVSGSDSAASPATEKEK